MKAIINALTLAMLGEWDNVTVPQARDFAERFVTENAELFVQQSAPVKTRPVIADLREPGQPLGDERLVVHKVPVVGPDGLTEKQRAAIGNVGLCANCQQPNNSHLPGCAKASGEDLRATTKGTLPPVS